MQTKYFALALAITVAAVPATACSRSYTEAGDVSPQGGVVLHVANNNFLDMDVFAVVDGFSTRVGTVTGSGAHDFVISSAMANRDLRIVATPIGGAGRASTGTINVAPGEEIDFKIGSVLSNSTVMIR